jgi:Phage minor structural protein GP20.
VSVQTNGSTGQAPAAGTPASGQAPQPTQDQQGQEQTGTPAGQAPQGEQDLQQIDPTTITDPALRAYVERQQAELRRARDEAARFRTERSTLAEQVQQFQRQSETAEQAAQREAAERQERLDALEQENRTLKVGQAVSTAAGTAGAHNPALVASMLDKAVTLGADGKPTNVDALITALKASDPYLFKVAQQSADAGAGRSRQAAPAGGMGDGINDLVRTRGRGAAAVR